MVEIKCDGKINNRPVKLVRKTTEYGTTFMVKPKRFDIDTPHITVLSNGKWEVHEDSADGRWFRTMHLIGEGSIDSGIDPFIRNEGFDMALVPLYQANFDICADSNGSRVSILTGNPWVLRAIGTYGPWKAKTEYMIS